MLSKEFQRDIEKIKIDTIHGAVYLTIEILKAIRKEVERTEETGVKEFNALIEELETIHPEMASIRIVIKLLKEGKSHRIKKKIDYLDLIDVIYERIMFKEKITSTNLMKILLDAQSIMTISYSSTILDAFKQLATNTTDKRVYVLESRPKREGIVLAKRLAELGFRVRLIADAAAGYYAKDADIIVVGADTILPDGSTLNKIGSFQLALIAKYYQKPFVVAASTNKLAISAPENLKELITDKPIEEIYESTIEKLTVKNIYFELIPRELVTIFVSDEEMELFPEENNK
ncbi:MAG: translation initiation factor eIF-2B [Candidatus Heimdallarchaeota archaeon]